MPLTRRDAAGLILASALTPLALARTTPVQAAPPVKIRAFGAASMVETFRADLLYAKALLDHCDMIVPMNDLKWEALRHDRAGFDFSGADEQITFAKTHGKTVRGHALVWHDALPDWVKALGSKQEADAELTTHIETVVGRYKGVIPSWDVVNEGIAHEPKGKALLRASPWLTLLGPGYIERAFQLAGKADPKAQLVLNDYDLEYQGPRFDARRAVILALVRRFRKKNIPIHAIGFQAHLYAERTLDAAATLRFIRDLAAEDVEVLVTELDVIDWRLPANIQERDRLAATHVKQFLDIMTADKPLETLVSWGITDRYSWINDTFKRDDNLPPRPLPLDRDYAAKPMMMVLDDYRGRAA